MCVGLGLSESSVDPETLRSPKAIIIETKRPPTLQTPEPSNPEESHELQDLHEGTGRLLPSRLKRKQREGERRKVKEKQNGLDPKIMVREMRG